MADALPAAALDQRCKDADGDLVDINIANRQYSVWSVQEGSPATLDASLSTLAWPQVIMILVVVLCAVLIDEWISARDCSREPF